MVRRAGSQWSRHRGQKHVITNQSKQISSLITARVMSGGRGSHQPVAVSSPGSPGPQTMRGVETPVVSSDITWGQHVFNVSSLGLGQLTDGGKV